ncbi:hypothetical protein [Pseudonocardia sp. HH130630-07]|uniref:hypothetical protein n=1 Tax=Pseudonocardia sp. HH130630-07 TaxID=1690815 RepID=UPI000A9FFEDA|nr:hypothetical protein [Pseudonocardia sp. HH130630-07]
MATERLRTGAVALVVALVAVLPVLVVPSAPGAAGPVGDPPPAVADPVAPPVPEASGGITSRPPGSVPVARAGEDGLELSWALLDTGTGDWTGSPGADADATEAESAIKAWLAADTLRAAAERGRAVTAAERSDITAAVRRSDDDAAERLYRAGGRDAVIDRLQPECGVDVSSSRRGWWSYTQVTAIDAARILACVHERAARWPGGADLLVDLASITPDGRSGIAATLPHPAVEKNGWTLHGGHWNVNCVLSWTDRALAVLTTFPGERGVEYGWDVCRDVAVEVLAADRADAGGL